MCPLQLLFTSRRPLHLCLAQVCAWLQDAGAAKFLQEVVEPHLSTAGIKAVLHIVRVPGSSATLIGEAICKQAAKHDAVFTILTKSSKNAITKLFVGSVTRYCVEHNDSAVVVL